jgi:alpha-ketoglutarate-dependent sulfate ester dioxygenase
MLSNISTAELDETPTTFELQPLTIRTGAEISGVDLKRPLTPLTIKEIWTALLKWKVIFFRGQNLDHAQHTDFARQFGEPTIGHVIYGHIDDHPEIYSIARGRVRDRYQDEGLIRPWSGWHTDLTTAINPPSASILRSVTIPPYGGDTQWTNLVAAYEQLSPTLHEFLNTLRGIHAYESLDASRADKNLSTEHPLIRVHPETGERILFLSPAFLQSIVGLTQRENKMLLEMLWEHMVRPEFVVRFKRQAGDIAFWKNRSTAHLAPEDFLETEFPRQLYRITLSGDIPVGVDGQSSHAIEGGPIPTAPRRHRNLKIKHLFRQPRGDTRKKHDENNAAGNNQSIGKCTEDYVLHLFARNSLYYE